MVTSCPGNPTVIALTKEFTTAAIDAAHAIGSSDLFFKPYDVDRVLTAMKEGALLALDSEHGNYTPGALEEYLQTYLYLKQLELNLVPFPDPREE